jgi:hypothetical protein
MTVNHSFWISVTAPLLFGEGTTIINLILGMALGEGLGIVFIHKITFKGVQCQHMFKEENFGSVDFTTIDKRTAILLRENAVMMGEAEPLNRNEKQLRLAFLLYIKESQEDTQPTKNEIMEYWIDEGYSTSYRVLEQDPLFKEHERLQGDFKNITVEDVAQYKKDGSLLE